MTIQALDGYIKAMISYDSINSMRGEFKNQMISYSSTSGNTWIRIWGDYLKSMKMRKAWKSGRTVDVREIW